MAEAEAKSGGAATEPGPTPAESLRDAAREVIEGVNQGAVLHEAVFRGEVTFHIDKRWILPVIRALKTDSGLQFGILRDVTAVDYLNTDRDPRFDVVYHLFSLNSYRTIRLKSPVAEDDCRIDSICELWSGANFMEREVYDLMGIRFDNHPNLERILMPDNWEGHPLRKDFPIGGSKSFYYRHDTSEYAGEPGDLVPRIRIQEGEI